jgi:hypothetical protein
MFYEHGKERLLQHRQAVAVQRAPCRAMMARKKIEPTDV